MSAPRYPTAPPVYDSWQRPNSQPRRDLPRSGEETEPIIPRGRISNYDTFPKLPRRFVTSGRIAKIVFVVVVSLLSFQLLTIWGRSLQLDEWSREVKEHERQRTQWRREHEASEKARLEFEQERREQWGREVQDHQREREAWRREQEASARERLEEWKQEMQAHEQEREEWRREREDQRAEFAKERLVFERERQGWQRERMAHKPFWGELEHVSPYCLAYNTMEYKARLWNVPLGGDWLQACQGTSQEIHGRTIEKPERCEDRGQNEGTWGYWRVDFDEPECITKWGTTWDKGCVRPGVHVVEAPMWGQKPSDDWYQMCWTTPGHLRGMSGDLGFPNDCQQRGKRGGGMVGVWEFYDGNCH